MFTKLVRDEKGSAIIIFTLGLTVFLGCIALVTDVGLLYLSKFRLVNAVDAAVLAGAQELPYHPLDAIEIANSYGAANGLAQDNITIELDNNNRIIKASGQREVKLFFAKFLGFSSGKVKHEAAAEVAPIVKVDGAAPLGIEEHEFVFGEQYTLKVGAGDTDFLSTEISPGWFGALALGGPGASTYEDNLTYGYTGSLRVGDIVDIQTGNISGPTKKAIDYRIAEDKHVPYCTVEHFERDCSRLIKVPVIEVVDKKSVRIIGFSMFLVDEVAGQGNDSYVMGKFVKTIAAGEISSDAQDFGLVGVRLIQ